MRICDIILFSLQCAYVPIGSDGTPGKLPEYGAHSQTNLIGAFTNDFFAKFIWGGSTVLALGSK
jgi:hypothetical protein